MLLNTTNIQTTSRDVLIPVDYIFKKKRLCT